MTTTPPYEPSAKWAKNLRGRLTSEQYQRSGNYTFALEDRPYTPAELHVFLRAVIWERLSGWEPENDGIVPDAVISALLEFRQLTPPAPEES